MDSQNITSTDTNDDNLNEINDKEYIRCFWCNIESQGENEFIMMHILQRGKENPSEFLFCSENHGLKTQRFFNYINKTYFLYVLFVYLFPIILVVLSIIFKSLIFIYSLFLSLGIGLVIIPLIGNQIMFSLGINKANILGRILGAMLILIGSILIIIYVSTTFTI